MIKYKQRKYYLHHKAQVFLLALAVFAISIAVGVGFLATSRTAYVIQQAQLYSLQAGYRAKTGTEIARKNLESDFTNYGYDSSGAAGGVLAANTVTFIEGGRATINVSALDAATGIRTVRLDGNFSGAHSHLQKRYMATTSIQPIYRFIDWSMGEIVDMDMNGNELRRIGGFDRPDEIAVNNTTGECWVSDTGHNQVVKVSADGQELARIGGFNVPRGISVNQATGECWVADVGSDRVFKLAANGSVLFTVKQVSPTPPFWLHYPVDVVVDSAGNCWVADYAYGRIVKLAPNGTVLLRPSSTAFGVTMDIPREFALDETRGHLWVAAMYRWSVGSAFCVYLFDSNTGAAKDLYFHQMRYPWEVSVNPNTGECWVGMAGNWGYVSRLAWNQSASQVEEVGAIWSLDNPAGVAVDLDSGGCWIRYNVMFASNDSLAKVDADGNIVLNYQSAGYLGSGTTGQGIVTTVVEVP